MKDFHLEDLTRVSGLAEVKVRLALEHLERANALLREPDERGGWVRAEIRPLSEAALQKIAAQIEAHRRHKRAMLENMMRYAETNACRRRVILSYFGDAGPAEAPLCCDNCLARAEAEENAKRPASSQSEQAALDALDAVSQLRGGLGKEKVARLLKGSAAKDLARYQKLRSYGKLAGLRVDEIQNLLNQLLRAGYLKSIGGSLPTLALTPTGEAVLKAQAAIQLKVRPFQHGAAARLKAEREAGGTIALTRQMLADGKTPHQIAAARGLTHGTIYSHLARLIATREVNIDAVVPVETQRRIRAAIEAVGSMDQLAPIKARLPDSIDFGPIRCVVEALKVENKAQ